MAMDDIQKNIIEMIEISNVCIDDTKRLNALFSDASANNSLYRNLLNNLISANVISELKTAENLELRRNQLKTLLERNYGISNVYADWIIETALYIINKGEYNIESNKDFQIKSDSIYDLPIFKSEGNKIIAFDISRRTFNIKLIAQRPEIRLICDIWGSSSLFSKLSLQYFDILPRKALIQGFGLLNDVDKILLCEKYTLPESTYLFQQEEFTYPAYSFNSEKDMVANMSNEDKEKRIAKGLRRLKRYFRQKSRQGIYLWKRQFISNYTELNYGEVLEDILLRESEMADSIGFISNEFIFDNLLERMDSPISELTEIENLELGSRSYNCLKRAGYRVVSDVIKAIDSDEIYNIKNLGPKNISEIISAIEDYKKNFTGDDVDVVVLDIENDSTKKISVKKQVDIFLNSDYRLPVTRSRLSFKNMLAIMQNGFLFADDIYKFDYKLLYPVNYYEISGLSTPVALLFVSEKIYDYVIKHHGLQDIIAEDNKDDEIKQFIIELTELDRKCQDLLRDY